MQAVTVAWVISYSWAGKYSLHACDECLACHVKCPVMYSSRQALLVGVKMAKDRDAQDLLSRCILLTCGAE
jgi:hypothetical protein